MAGRSPQSGRCRSSGDDPAPRDVGAHYLRELLPRPEFWTVMPPEQPPERVHDRILEFGRTHK